MQLVLTLLILLFSTSSYGARSYEKSCAETILQGDKIKYKNSKYLPEFDTLIVYELVSGNGSKPSDYVQYTYSDIGTINSDKEKKNYWCVDPRDVPGYSPSDVLTRIFNETYSKKKKSNSPDRLNYLKSVGFACKDSKYTGVQDSLIELIPNEMPASVQGIFQNLQKRLE